MREKYEGQRLTWLFRALWVFAIIGVVAVLGLIGWSLYALWGVLP